MRANESRYGTLWVCWGANVEVCLSEESAKAYAAFAGDGVTIHRQRVRLSPPESLQSGRVRRRAVQRTGR